MLNKTREWDVVDERDSIDLITSQFCIVFFLQGRNMAEV